MGNVLSNNLPYIYDKWTTDKVNKYRWIWAEKDINTDKYSEIKKEAKNKMEDVITDLSKVNQEKKIVVTQLQKLIDDYKKKELDFYKTIGLSMEGVTNPIPILTKYFFMNINDKQNLKNEKYMQTIDFNSIKNQKTCFKLIIADRNFSKIAQNFLTGSMFSRTLYFNSSKGEFGKKIKKIIENEESSSKRKKMIAEEIKKSKKIKEAILNDLRAALKEALRITEDKEESFNSKFNEKLEKKKLMKLSTFEDFKDKLKELGEELNESGMTLEVKPAEGGAVYMTVGVEGDNSDIISSLYAALKNFRPEDPTKLDLMGIGKYTIEEGTLQKGIEKAQLFLKGKNGQKMIKEVSYSKGAKAGVSGFIGELLGYLNFSKKDITVQHSGTEMDTVNLSQYAPEDKKSKYENYQLGSSFSDEKIRAGEMKFGVNIKHYISKENKNEYFHIYKPSEVSLFDNQAIYRYFPKETVFLMRFAYLNYKFYKNISGLKSLSDDDFIEDVKNFSIISVGNFIRLSSPEEINLFYQINNLIIPASMILSKMQQKMLNDMDKKKGYDYFQIDFKGFPEPLNKGEMTFDQFKEEAKNSLLISQRPRKLAIKYRGLEINLSDLKFR